MATFREKRNALLLGTFCKCNSRIIICFALHLHTSKNLDHPYWSELRLLKGDVCRLFQVFDIPILATTNQSSVD